MLGRAIGMYNGTLAIGEYDAAAEHIERFDHTRTLDGASVEHIADSNRTTEMREQKQPNLDLSVRDGAVSLVASNHDFREMRRRVHQEKVHDVDDAERFQTAPTFLSIKRRSWRRSFRERMADSVHRPSEGAGTLGKRRTRPEQGR
jgi:hypothetical protein